MYNRHPWPLKKSKSWGPFWSYQLNSIANSAHLAHFLGGLDLIYLNYFDIRYLYFFDIPMLLWHTYATLTYLYYLDIPVLLWHTWTTLTFLSAILLTLGILHVHLFGTLEYITLSACERERESLVWASHNCTEDLIDGMIEATTQSSRNVDQVTGIFIFSYVIFGHTPTLED